MRTRLLAGSSILVLLAGLASSFALVSQTSPEVSAHAAVCTPLPAGTIRLGVARRPLSLHISQPPLAPLVGLALPQGVEFFAPPSLQLRGSAGSLRPSAPRAPPA